MEIDDTLAEAHIPLAVIKAQYDWDWSGAETEYQLAISLKPDDSTAHDAYATFLRRAGRSDQAITEYKRALELDPLSVAINRDLAYAYYEGRRYDRTQCRWKQIPMNLALGMVYPQSGVHRWPLHTFASPVKPLRVNEIVAV